MSTTEIRSIRDRLILVIRAVTSDARRFKELEEKTHVPSATWRSFWNREGALPSGAMLEEVGREWPQFAFWLLAGIADHQPGHVAPDTAEYLPEAQRTESTAATAYFKARVRAENSRPSRLPLDSLRDFALREQAMQMLGGRSAVAGIHKELEEHGILDAPLRNEPFRLSGLLEKTSDPVLDRAVQVLQREKEAEQARNFADLKKARDTDFLIRVGDLE